MIVSYKIVVSVNFFISGGFLFLAIVVGYYFCSWRIFGLVFFNFRSFFSLWITWFMTIMFHNYESKFEQNSTYLHVYTWFNPITIWFNSATIDKKNHAVLVVIVLFYILFALWSYTYANTHTMRIPPNHELFENHYIA